MNYAMVAYFLGSILKFEAAFLALPCIVALYYGEASGLAYLAVALVCLAGGLLITRKKPKSTVFYTKEGFMSVALGWILISAMGALPTTISFGPGSESECSTATSARVTRFCMARLTTMGSSI